MPGTNKCPQNTAERLQGHANSVVVGNEPFKDNHSIKIKIAESSVSIPNEKELLRDSMRNSTQ